MAYYEAGHAVLAAVLPHADAVHKVTILPAGMALGATEQVPTEERQIRRRPELEDALAVGVVGGPPRSWCSRSSPPEPTTTWSALPTWPGAWCGSGACPTASGGHAWGSQGPVFLGEDLIHTRDYSDETARVIDEEVTRILDEQADRAAEELGHHRRALDELAAALLDHETLEAAEIARIIGRAGSAGARTAA